ncbi:MAG TPA: class I SAM-dependent methyltransferase [Sedimentisphaerales bacterium]|nr:class I SAM-dependent methyltransferase [Sedimentisphaerales bacterium]
MILQENIGFSNWVCPKCKGDLKVEDGVYFCEPCGQRFNDFLGLPDFRLHYKDTKNEVALAKEFRESWNELTYEDMVRMRWSGLRQRALARGKHPSDFKMWDVDEQAHLATYKVRGKHHQYMLKNIIQRKIYAWEIIRLVDVGCGWGRDLLHLACLAQEAIGVDVSAFSLLMTKKLLEGQGVTNVTLVLAEGESLPLPPECIDGINCSGAIEHMRIPGDFCVNVQDV